jgi:hypothetical protein
MNQFALKFDKVSLTVRAKSRDWRRQAMLITTMTIGFQHAIH